MGLESPLKVSLIGNYKPDAQESMERFCLAMADGLRKQGVDVRILRPDPVLVRKGRGYEALNKWLGYIDKFILFPLVLNRACRESDIVHVCDHSNSMYLHYLKSIPHLITCHDLLAVRAALGENTYCLVSPFGKILQRLILRGLKQASMIVCDSQATKTDVERLVGIEQSRIRLVPLGQNYPYSVIDFEQAWQRLQPCLHRQRDLPYLLHVGSSEPRKNRDGILRIFAKIKSQFKGKLVLAGSPLTAHLRQLVANLGLQNDVIEVIAPDNYILEALYNRAFALIYPSHSEGFGWPIIEAQACGCPVVTSKCGPCPEVAGVGALVNDTFDEEGFARSVLSLRNESERNRVVEAGFANLRYYNMEKTVSSYLEIYKELRKEHK
jgi:glycosyltransferase involved in cell wall biosynthesis